MGSKDPTTEQRIREDEVALEEERGVLQVEGRRLAGRRKPRRMEGKDGFPHNFEGRDRIEDPDQFRSRRLIQGQPVDVRLGFEMEAGLLVGRVDGRSGGRATLTAAVVLRSLLSRARTVILVGAERAAGAVDDAERLKGREAEDQEETRNSHPPPS